MPVPAAVPRPEPVCGVDTWMPVPVRIVAVRRETFNTQTFTMRIQDPQVRDLYRWVPGQFNMIYVPAVGEAAISISSDPAVPETIGHTIRVVGSVTRAIERLGAGGLVGLRGPFGSGWPIDALDGQDVVLVAGGIGLAPIRPVIYHLLRNRNRYGRVMLFYGCRTPEDRPFADELAAWSSGPSIEALVTVDHVTGSWDGPVGVVTKLLSRIRIDARRTVVMVCGPRMLNRVAAWSFLRLHVPPEQVYVSLERNMNCGFGRCGHCQYGSKFVCRDGPIFRFADIADSFGKEEI